MEPSRDSPAGSAEPMIRAEGLAKRFGGGPDSLTIFEGLDFSLSAGERVALTGESGAGKTTLMYLLGLLDTPSAGRVLFGGRDATAMDEASLAALRNREIGFVWQMNTLLVEFTALENVLMPLSIRGTPRREAETAARERLEEVGLAGRAGHLAGELSGGEQQRVVLARALAGNPRILLADEPTGNLDEKTGARIIELIERLHETHRLATLYVTHNPDFARRASRVVELRSGHLARV